MNDIERTSLKYYLYNLWRFTPLNELKEELEFAVERQKLEEQEVLKVLIAQFKTRDNKIK